MGLKNSVLSLLGKQTKPSEGFNACLTMGLLSVMTGAALLIQDLGFIAALTGSLMGSLIIYVFPGMFKYKRLKKQAGGQAMNLGDFASTYGLMGLGAVLGVIGVAVASLRQFTTLLG